MKSLLAIICILAPVVGCSKPTVDSHSLVELNSADYGDTKNFFRIVELERNANTSKFKLTYKKMGSPVGFSMFIARGAYKVAKARGTEYFLFLKEWDDGDGGRIYIIGFTDNENPDIQAEFGEEFSSTLEDGQTARPLLSVSQCALLFEGQKK